MQIFSNGEWICMKSLILFSRENKEKINFAPAELAQRVVKFNR